MGHYPVRCAAICFEVPFDDDQLWAAFDGGCHRHRRVDTELPRRVRERRNDAALVRPPADSKRLSAQRRVTLFFDRAKESIPVKMQNFPYHHRLSWPTILTLFD